MYRVIKASEMFPETRNMIALSYRLRNYFGTFYQIEIIDKYRMYVIPEGEDLNQFIDDILDFVEGEIIDIEGSR